MIRTHKRNDHFGDEDEMESKRRANQKVAYDQ